MFHGCPNCFPDDRNTVKHPSTNQTLKELNDMTKNREKELKNLGYKLVIVWEHQFKFQLEKNAALQQFVSILDLQERLDPRESFFVVEPVPSNCIIKLQKTKPYSITILPVSIPGPTSIVGIPSAIRPSSRTIFRNCRNILDLLK